jgi:hypothetical protein
MGLLIKMYLESLKQIDLEMLYWALKDKTTEEIADKWSENLHNPNDSISARDVNYHLGKIYKTWDIKGNGRQKKTNLVCLFQKDMNQLYPTEASLKKHKRKALSRPLLYSTIIDKLMIDDFSHMEIHWSKRQIKFVMRDEVADIFFEACKDDIKKGNMPIYFLVPLDYDSDEDPFEIHYYDNEDEEYERHLQDILDYDEKMKQTEIDRIERLIDETNDTPSPPSKTDSSETE